MTNTQQTADLFDTLRPGMHLQFSNGSIHQITDVKIRRTPKRGLLREARIRSGITRTWLDLIDTEWRIVSPLADVIRGSHNSIDGVDHSYSCTGTLTTVYQLAEGWSKMCRRCGFAVTGHDTREQAEAAYLADQVGAYR